MESRGLIKRWKGNKRYTLKFFELVEEDQFDWKPTEASKTYKSQLSHITTWMRTHSRFVTGVTMDKPAVKTKVELITSIEAFFDALLDFLEQTNEEELNEVVDMWYGKVSKASVLMTMENHLSHHRGQLVVYLRLLEIKAPSYIGW